MPTWLPRYDVNMDMNLAEHVVHVTMRATWTNPHTEPTHELVFNAHARYVVPEDQIGLTAKTLEIFRMNPGEGMGEREPALEIRKATLVNASGPGKDEVLAMRYEGDTKTSLVLPLPYAVKPGESATVLLEMTMHLPQKQGRWGQWREVTFLTNWLPVFAVFGKAPPPRGRGLEPPTPNAEPVTPNAPTTYAPCWQPTPFIPWHQPFFNEAAHYHVRVATARGPECGVYGCHRRETRRWKGGGARSRFAPTACATSRSCAAPATRSTRAKRSSPRGRTVPIRVLAFEEHEHYAREMVRIATEALDHVQPVVRALRLPGVHDCRGASSAGTATSARRW